MEFNGSAFTTAAVVSGLAYGLYAFTTRGNQNQNQNQNNQRSNNNFVQSMNPFSQNQNQRRYGGKKTLKNKK